jgi:hypothetical protein
MNVQKAMVSKSHFLGHRTGPSTAAAAFAGQHRCHGGELFMSENYIQAAVPCLVRCSLFIGNL